MPNSVGWNEIDCGRLGLKFDQMYSHSLRPKSIFGASGMWARM